MAYPRLNELIKNLKILQPKPVSVAQDMYDLILKTAVSRIINQVVAFTNMPSDELPEEFDTPVLLKLADWFSEAGVFMTDDERRAGAVTSIKEGDIQINYGNPQQALQSLGSVSFIDADFRALLMRYRRIRGWDYDNRSI